METKPLLYGLIGFLLGGLLVSIVATTIEKPRLGNVEVLMSEMAASLEDRRGDDFDKAFISNMIEHHEGATSMASLAETRAKHPEIKQLSKEIITAQEKEMDEMKRWQRMWGYDQNKSDMHTQDSSH